MNDYILEKVKSNRAVRYYRIDCGKPEKQISASTFYRLSLKLERLQRQEEI